MPIQLGRLVATYSIVARDPETAQLGVAVQSCYFSVGTEVSWSLPGVGAIATQAIHEIAHGPRGLDCMARGLSAQKTLEELLAADAGAALRQLAIVDAKGGVAAHTGALCVPACGHALGDGYSVQGNMLASDAVWQAMGPAFERAEGDLADRMMAALEAADRAGGDVRGRQSAALLVTSGEATPNEWEGRIFDVHVEDHPEPLEELRRLIVTRRAYALFETAREQLGAGEADAAFELMEAALALRPDDPQFTFWAGVGFANLGRNDQARQYLDRSFAVEEGWRQLGLRLQAMGLYSGDPALLES